MTILLATVAATFLVAAVRVLIGPTLADRAVAVDVCFYVLIGSLLLLSIRQDTLALMDIAAAAPFVAFLGTVALAHLVERDE